MPLILLEEILILHLENTHSWMTPYIRYSTDDIEPTNPDQAKIIKINASHFTMIYVYLFSCGFSLSLLRYLIKQQLHRVVQEIYERVCHCYIYNCFLANKIILATCVEFMNDKTLCVSPIKYFILHMGCSQMFGM